MKPLPVINCCTPLAGASLSDGEATELERLFRVLGDRKHHGVWRDVLLVERRSDRIP